MSLADLSFVVTEEQLILNRTVDAPSWLNLECTDVQRELSKSVGKDGNKSWNTWFHFIVEDGDYKGMKLRFNVNEKMEGMGYEMFAAFLGRALKVGESFIPANCIGQKVCAMVVKAAQKTDPNKFFNTITNWKPAKS
jgi:hypothetical protein